VSFAAAHSRDHASPAAPSAGDRILQAWWMDRDLGSSRKEPTGRAGDSEIVRYDPLLRQLRLNLLFGVAVAILAVGGLLLLDVSGLRHLILSDQSPALALAMLLCGFVFTFGGGVIGTAMMQLEDAD